LGLFVEPLDGLLGPLISHRHKGEISTDQKGCSKGEQITFSNLTGRLTFSHKFPFRQIKSQTKADIFIQKIICFQRCKSMCVCEVLYRWISERCALKWP
jgi:hypothetical protein